MQKGLFQKIKQAVSGRLLILKKKVNKELFKKYAVSFHSRVQSGKQHLAAFLVWLRQKFGLEAWKSYGRIAVYWCRFWLGKEARQVYAWTAKNWIKKHLSRDAMKGYMLAAARWLRELPGKLTWANFKKWSIAFWHWLSSLPERMKTQRKYALLASVALLALWLYLGSATTLAWYTDVTPVERNSFVVGQMKLDVQYKNDKVTTYTDMTEDSAVFNDEALYEPGYTQVVYFRIKNEGDIAFDYKITVKDFQAVDSTNVFGETLHLPKYLRFGIVTSDTEFELNPREAARQLANKEMEAYYLGEYSQTGYMLEAKEDDYAALVVWMPEYVGNEANYRGETVPQVTLGVTVFAQQAGAPMD